MITEESKTTHKFYCIECDKVTEHIHKFSAGNHVNYKLRKCKVCKHIKGDIIILWMSKAQIQEWATLVL